MLVLVMFSCVCSFLNTVGWYAIVLPEQKMTITEGRVTELTQGVGKTSINPWTMWTVMATTFGVLGGALLSLVTVVPFLMGFGVAFEMALMVQVPIYLILAWTVYEMWTGHTTVMQE